MAMLKGSAEKSVVHTRITDQNDITDTYMYDVDWENMLGKGTFGTVHAATHKGTGEHLAIKTVNKEKAGSSTIKLLEREVSILKRVNHENIISLNEVFETAQKMYLVMELCDGGELADALKEKKYYSEAETKVIIEKLASAIAYLHKNDIVHRDIKLENILLSTNPQNPEDHLHIKVTDFGLSVVMSGSGHDNMMQDFCGTPMYMAPEIIDNKTYSQQCDVWAMGVIMYTVMCGHAPFVSKDEDSLYDIIKKGKIDFNDEVWQSVSAEAKNCIEGMLKIDPAHRKTASEVITHPWITGEELPKQPGNVLEMMKQWQDLRISENPDNLDDGEVNGEISGDSQQGSGVSQDVKVQISESSSTEDGTDSSTTATDSSHRKTPTETSRKGSAGSKHPVSGGKSKTSSVTKSNNVSSGSKMGTSKLGGAKTNSVRHTGATNIKPKSQKK